MKKLYLLIGITCFSVMSFAQPETELNNVKVDTTEKQSVIAQEKLNKLEKEIEALKASQAELHKQLAEIKQQLPVAKKKKPAVSRVGSKQGVLIEE